jgi:hypothetical protein
MATALLGISDREGIRDEFVAGTRGRALEPPGD